MRYNAFVIVNYIEEEVWSILTKEMEKNILLLLV